ncbi:MAG: hypothetical protein K6A96_03045 [Prevotella sp.]|nr:hypothetical protein [Prevotella sp.]
MSKPTHCLSVLLLLLVAVLAACSGDGSQMRAQLEELERQNRADSVMTNDSLAEQLVKYFDRHGTPNERMRAHYILGRTYADMGRHPVPSMLTLMPPVRLTPLLPTATSAHWDVSILRWVMSTIASFCCLMR